MQNVQVFPASAGVIPAPEPPEMPQDSFPRIRGGDPQQAKNSCWRLLCSRCMTTGSAKKCQKLLKRYLYCVTTTAAR